MLPAASTVLETAWFTGSACHSKSGSDAASDGVSDSSFIISGSSSRSCRGMTPFGSDNGSLIISPASVGSCILGISWCSEFTEVVGPFKCKERGIVSSCSWRGISGRGGVLSPILLSLPYPAKFNTLGDGCEEFPKEFVLAGDFRLWDLKKRTKNNSTWNKLGS